jgi:hypothetical protein
MAGFWPDWSGGKSHEIATVDESGTFLTSDSSGNAGMKPYLTQAQNSSGQTQTFNQLETKMPILPFGSMTVSQLQDSKGRCFGKNLQFQKGNCGSADLGQFSSDSINFLNNQPNPNIGYASYHELVSGGKQLLCMNPQGYYPDIYHGYPDSKDVCTWIDKESVIDCCTNPSTLKECGGWRSGTGSSCVGFMMNYCTENNWNDPQGVCKNFIDNPALGPDAKLVVHNYVLQYIKDQPYSSQDPVYKNIIPYLCSRPNVFGVCDDVLTNFCQNYTSEDLQKDGTLQVLCGCHLPQNDYKFSGWGIPSSCDPLCLYQNTVQNATYQPCKSTSCIIDNVTVDIINSQVGNGINFGQVCGSCGGSGVCECWLSGININDVNSIINGGINLSQSCNNNCFYVPEGQDPRTGIPVDCNTLEPKGCQNSKQCPSGQQCVNGKCVNTGQCTTNQQCPSPQICVNGKCTRQCGNNNNCFLGEVCVDGVCVNNKTGCTSDSQCQPNYECVQGECQEKETNIFEMIINWFKKNELISAIFGVILFLIICIIIFLTIKHLQQKK